MEKKIFTQESLQNALSRLIARASIQKEEPIQYPDDVEEVKKLKLIIKKLAQKLQKQNTIPVPPDYQHTLEIENDLISFKTRCKDLENQLFEALIEKAAHESLKEEITSLKLLQEKNQQELIKALKEKELYKKNLTALEEIQNTSQNEEQLPQDVLGLYKENEKKLTFEKNQLNQKLELLEKKVSEDTKTITSLETRLMKILEQYTDYELLLRKNELLEKELQEHKRRFLLALTERKELEQSIENHFVSQELIEKRLEAAKRENAEQKKILDEAQARSLEYSKITQELKEERHEKELLRICLEEQKNTLEEEKRLRKETECEIEKNAHLLEEQTTHKEQLETHLAKRVRECALITQQLEEEKQKALSIERKMRDLESTMKQLETMYKQKDKATKAFELQCKKEEDSLRNELQEEKMRYATLNETCQEQQKQLLLLKAAEEKLQQFEAIFGQFGKLFTKEPPPLEKMPPSFFSGEERVIFSSEPSLVENPSFIEKDSFV